MNHLIRGGIDSVDLVSRLTCNVPVRLTRNYYPINFPRCTKMLLGLKIMINVVSDFMYLRIL